MSFSKMQRDDCYVAPAHRNRAQIDIRKQLQGRKQCGARSGGELTTVLGELAAGARVPSGEKMAKVAQRAMGHRPAGPGGSSQNPGPPRRQSHSC